MMPSNSSAKNASMVLGLGSVLAMFIVGKLTGVPQMLPGFTYLWFVAAACVWIGALVFAALGLFIGYLQLVHAPLLGGSIDIMWVVNAVAWFGIFVAGAVYLFRKDTARV